MLERDPRDPRQRERLAGSYLASLLLHALIAAFIFTLASSSSQQGASESVSGGTVVTIEQRTPVVAVAPAPAQQAAPVPNVPHIAPVVQHAPLVQAQRQPNPPQHHELSVFKPTAPPNPTPVPQASEQPNPQPTTPIYEPNPQNQLPAVPTSVPSIGPQQVAIKIPPSAAPSPLPSVPPDGEAAVAAAARTNRRANREARIAGTAAQRETHCGSNDCRARREGDDGAECFAKAGAGAPSAAPAANAGVPSPSPTQGPSKRPKAAHSRHPARKPKARQAPNPARPATPKLVPLLRSRCRLRRRQSRNRKRRQPHRRQPRTISTINCAGSYRTTR